MAEAIGPSNTMQVLDMQVNGDNKSMPGYGIYENSGDLVWGMRANWLISSLFEKSLICDVKPGGPGDPLKKDSELGSTSKGCKSGMAGLLPVTLLVMGMMLIGWRFVLPSPFSIVD
ncbi:hypothetical protein B0H11DRAFT_2208056 [Mycena galericulata]|nr:hypothetical protein B0H11DRAFT_2208056 [Mycena galericulata]